MEKDTTVQLLRLTNNYLQTQHALINVFTQAYVYMLGGYANMISVT